MKYIAFLRAINVGGHNLTMARLRELFEELGFKNVETFIASGNVIFDSPVKDAAKLEKKIEKHLETALGYAVATFLRTPQALAALARHEAFDAAARSKAGAYNILLLSEPLAAESHAKLAALKTDIDDFHAHEREIYWLCRARQSDSKFSNVVLEKKLGIRSTFRGAGTIDKLVAKFCCDEA